MSNKGSPGTARLHGLPDTLSEFLQAENNDEGCVLDHEIEEAPGVSVDNDRVPKQLINAPMVEDGDLDGSQRLDHFNKTKDSGLSSRMSEKTVGSVAEDKAAQQSLLDARGVKKRLKRISECQYEEPCRCSVQGGLKATAKILVVFILLYCFICTLDVLSNAFRLLGGKTAGSVFSESDLLLNPITGLMIGVMATVLLQSSSTSSSIVITMVASNILPIQPAIPIIMGANIGTTVTNTLVSLAHSMDRKEFRRAFSGAVVHDVFNWLTVLILLPLEYCTGYLYHLTSLIVGSMNLESVKAKNQDLLKKLTKPLTSMVVSIDKKVITGIAEGKEGYANKSLLKKYCSYEKVPVTVLVNTSSVDNATGETVWEMLNTTQPKKEGKDKCDALFNTFGWSDSTTGAILFILSILCLSLCLYLMVKVLHSLLGRQIAKAARKTINADFPRPFHWLTGYVAIIVGAGMTILVQSSSVFTSALTPLVGIGCLKLERMFPLTLGSNIGTTFTGVLAALAAPPETVAIALQLAFCHLFFNISGILIFYPVPRMRKVVISTAKYLGRTTATYRWFAIAYLIFMFILFPLFFFGVSMAGKVAFAVVICILALLALTILIINVMQKYQRFRNYLPEALRSWSFLPKFMRSLEPYDSALGVLFSPFKKYCCQCCLNRCKCLTETQVDMGEIDSDTDESDGTVDTSVLPSAASSRIFLNSSSPDSKEANRIVKPNRKSEQSKKLAAANRRETSDVLKSKSDSVNLLISTSDNCLKIRDTEGDNLEVTKSSSSSNSSDDSAVLVHSTSSLESEDGNDTHTCDLTSVDIDNLRESKI